MARCILIVDTIHATRNTQPNVLIVVHVILLSLPMGKMAGLKRKPNQVFENYKPG